MIELSLRSRCSEVLFRRSSLSKSIIACDHHGKPRPGSQTPRECTPHSSSTVSRSSPAATSVSSGPAVHTSLFSLSNLCNNQFDAGSDPRTNKISSQQTVLAEGRRTSSPVQCQSSINLGLRMNRMGNLLKE